MLLMPQESTAPISEATAPLFTPRSASWRLIDSMTSSPGWTEISSIRRLLRASTVSVADRIVASESSSDGSEILAVGLGVERCVQSCGDLLGFGAPHPVKEY